jgi:hypothetical protein
MPYYEQCPYNVMCVTVTDEGEPADFYLGDLLAQLSAVVAAKPSERINICEGKICSTTIYENAF